ncbi:MAG: extracellular solute-binding protein, partial [Firmicutes bacterium]|nr:extracellular solute-binding protein [Bacillota bacterium]
YRVSLAGGVMPDVGWVSPDWFVPFYTEELLVPIEELLERDGIDGSSFWPGVWKQGVGGRQWGMPFEVGSEALIYNRDWFDAAGIGEPPQTWDDFLTVAKRLTDPERGRWGFEPGWPGYMSIQWVWRNGGGLVSDDLRQALFDQPETVEAVQWLADLERVHRVTGGHVPTGTAGMIVVHTGWFEFAKTFPFTFGTDPAPISETGQRASLSYYKELVLFRSTPEREEAAWRFIRWFSEPEQQAQWGERTGYLPVNRQALQLESYQQYMRDNPRLLPWITELDDIRNFPLTPAWGQILQMFESALTQVRQGQAAGTVMAAAQSAAQAILDEHAR